MRSSAATGSTRRSSIIVGSYVAGCGRTSVAIVPIVRYNSDAATHRQRPRSPGSSLQRVPVRRVRRRFPHPSCGSDGPAEVEPLPPVPWRQGADGPRGRRTPGRRSGEGRVGAVGFGWSAAATGRTGRTHPDRVLRGGCQELPARHHVTRRRRIRGGGRPRYCGQSLDRRVRSRRGGLRRQAGRRQGSRSGCDRRDRGRAGPVTGHSDRRPFARAIDRLPAVLLGTATNTRTKET